MIPFQELISDVHALIIWEEIIRESDALIEIAEINNLAKDVQRNYNHLREYLINPSDHTLNLKVRLIVVTFMIGFIFIKEKSKKKV